MQEDLLTRASEIEEQLTTNQQQALSLGLAGTPGYLIGPILVRGGLDEPEFIRVFAMARE